MTFSEMNLAEPILRAVALEKYATPSPIQKEAIPLLLAGKDMFGCAQTGTGKTAAFALPIVQKLYEGRGKSAYGRAPKALVLTPTRELATQVADSFKAFARFSGVKVATVYGGVSQRPQVDALRSGVDVLVATPGRLVDLMQQKLCTLRNISTLVLDEADHMLDLGFIHDVTAIIAKIPAERQTLMFSATMPKEIASLAASILRNPVNVAVAPTASPVLTIAQTMYHVDKPGKGRLLVELLQKAPLQSSLVFTRTKHGADKVCKMLNTAGIAAKAIHGDKSQGARQDAMTAFKKGKLRVLVATDIAARGIDVQDLPHVVNYDLPDVPETYVHRIGRTGRAGKAGVAVSFCSPEERQLLRDIERLIKTTIPVAGGYSARPVDTRSAPALTPVRAKATPTASRKERGAPKAALPAPMKNSVGGWSDNSRKPARSNKQQARPGHPAKQQQPARFKSTARGDKKRMPAGAAWK